MRKALQVTLLFGVLLICSSFRTQDIQYYANKYSGSEIPTLQLDFNVSNFGTKDFRWKHYLYLVKDKDYQMTISVNNPAIPDKRLMITLEFVDGAKYYMMSTPHHSEIPIIKSLYFNFSLNEASKIGGTARTPQFVMHKGRGAEIAYMLCTVPLKAIKIGDVSLPLENIPTPADYAKVYAKGLNMYGDSRYFDLLRQLLNYGWPRT